MLPDHGALPVPLTVSRAVAQLEGSDGSFADLYRRAEAALERARRRGGNVTVTAPADVPAATPGPDPEGL
jgi:hypothetical protein